MVAWKQLARLSDAELARHDIAAVNLACAEGLPGAERVDAARCLKTLGAWAETVRDWTRAAYREFYCPNPAAYGHSEARFKVVALLTVLGRHCGVRYDPAKIGVADDAPFDTHESFVYGVTDGPGGTCASLPVVYASVGRRLGYPLKLVKAKRHLFCRWDDPGTGERVNFEGGNDGYGIHPDDRYHLWPLPITPEVERNYGYLESLSPRRELASFLGQRAYVLAGRKRFREAVETFIAASSLEPTNPTYPHAAVLWLGEWRRHLRAELPPGFPRQIGVLRPINWRRWPWLEAGMEREVAALHATEYCLRRPDYEESWWQPLRQGRRPRHPVPASLDVDYAELVRITEEEESPCTHPPSAASSSRTPSASLVETRIYTASWATTR
jgi:hypothetical protein